MNPSAAFCVRSDTVTASANRFSEFDNDQSRKLDFFHPSSLPSERSGVVSRTGTAMAGSFKGGLASLLASPAVTGTPLQRSAGSDQFLVSTFSSDFSSESSLSRSYQALSSLSATPRSKDKSPTGLALGGNGRVMAALSSSPGFALGTLLHPSSMGCLSTSHPLHLASLPSTTKDPGHYFPSHCRRSVNGGIHDSITAASSSDRLGSVLLQAKPSKPSHLGPSFLRSVGFSLPGGSSLTPIQSTNQLSELSSVGSDRDLERSVFDPVAPTSSMESEGFMTPVTSLNTLFEPQAHGPGPNRLPEGSYLTPVSSLNTLLENRDHDQGTEGRFAGNSAGDCRPAGFQGWRPNSTGSLVHKNFPAGSPLSDAITGRLHQANVTQQREDVLRMVEAANAVRPSPSIYDKDALLLQAQKEHAIFYEPLVKRAFEVAATAHFGQTRKNGMPVISHCLETALILAKVGAGSAVVAAGLLHDCLDDTPMTEDQLEAAMGAPVAELVKGVSNLSSLSQRMRDSGGALSTAEHDRLQESGLALSDGELDRLRMMILSMADVRVVLIKLADRLHNLRTLSALPSEKQRRVASETLEVFAPLANRLGIWTWKAEIEDICFRTLWSKEHRELRTAVEGTHGDESVLRSIRKLDSALREGGVDFDDLHGRAKNLYSIFCKMTKKGKTLSEVFDRRGIRLIVPDKRSCYESLNAVRSVWRNELTEHFKDYIESPKGNGYQSIHVVVEDEDGHPLEIQIRTAAMHEEAEFGVAAHWRYKEAKKEAGSSRSIKIGDIGVFVEEDDDEERMSMQRVEWLRYVLSWVAEITDCKVRLADSEGLPRSGSPGCRSGSPGCGGQLAGMAGCCGAGNVMTGMSMCQFPEHREDCCFQPGSSGRAVPTPPLPDSEPLLVLLVENDKVSVKKLRATGTRQSFLRDYLAERGQLHMLTRTSLLVNSELMSVTDDKFRIGDQLEVIMDAPVSPQFGPSGQPGSLPCSPGGLDEDELLFEADVVAEAGLGEPGVDAETSLLPKYARDAGCPLALEFQRHKLAVAYGSTENSVLQPAHNSMLS